MSHRISDKGPVTFQDVTAYFSEEEWKLLHDWQKEVYTNVMKEIHQALLSLGPLIATSVFSLRPKENEETYLVEQSCERIPSDNCFTSDPIINAEVLFAVNGEEDLCLKNPQHSERRESTASQRIGLQVSKTDSGLKKKKRDSTPIVLDHMGVDGKLGTSPIIEIECAAPTCISLHMKEETLSHTSGHRDCDGRENTNSQAGITFLKRDVCPRNEEPAVVLLDVTHARQERSSYTSLGSQNINNNSLLLNIKDEEERINSYQVPEGSSTINDSVSNGKILHRTGRAEDLKCKEVNKPAASENDTFTTRLNADYGAYPGSPLWSNITQCGNDFDNQIPSRSCLEIPIELDMCDKFSDSASDQRISFQQNPLEISAQYTETDNSCVENTQYNKQHRIHEGNIPCKCKECERNFNQEKNSGYKKTTVEEKPFQCMKCKKSFSQKGNLFSHLRTHTRERPYRCCECEKCFIYKASLIYHQRTHSGERPYQCSQCEKSFNQKSDLVNHERTHTGERPYLCTECGKTFNQKRNLTAHRKTHDRILPNIISSNMRPEQC